MVDAAEPLDRCAGPVEVLGVRLPGERGGDGPYDCTIVADPATYLLVSTGRMAQSTAIALGLLGATGEHPELGLTFGARFRYP